MDYSIARRRMVDQQIRARGITNQQVLQALQTVPRHLFVEAGLQSHAYSDSSLPIGHKQTISQPYIVAAMTAALELDAADRVLEIGTGSGYQTAVLATLAKRVYSVERIAALAKQARQVLDQLQLSNVNIKTSDGTCGWPEQAPFNAILVAAGSPDIPAAYLEQLAVGGRLVIPVGDLRQQQLVRLVRQPDGSCTREELMGCRFVPLIGAAGWQLDDCG